MQQSSRSLPRRGEGCAESREDLGRPAREEPLLLSREPKFAGRALSGDRGGNPVAFPAPSKPPQLRGATRTAVLAVCLDFSLPSGTGSPPTASLALPQGRARGRELGKGFREEQRAFLGGSGRLGLPSQLLSPPMAPPRLSAPSSPLPSWATQRVSGTRGKGSFRTPPFPPAELAPELVKNRDPRGLGPARGCAQKPWPRGSGTEGL